MTDGRSSEIPGQAGDDSEGDRDDGEDGRSGPAMTVKESGGTFV